MTNKPVSLIQLTNLKDNKELSEAFVRYIAGLPSRDEYRHQEIEDIASLLANFKLPESCYSDFIYSYRIPHPSEEFDLIKITKDHVLNIELKSQMISKAKIKEQLKHHEHVLKLLSRQIYCFTYVSNTNKLFRLYDGKLFECSFEMLKDVLASSLVAQEIDLDEVFSPKNILVSPLNNPERFINGEYLLTQHQCDIKQNILSKIRNCNSAIFLGITGGPGTGKTLLLYDIAKELSKTMKVLVIHCGELCEGHRFLESNLENVQIRPAKHFRNDNDIDHDIGCILLDEAQRIYDSILEKIIRRTRFKKLPCIISYDEKQRLSHSEFKRKSVSRIDTLCEKPFKLTTTIRANEETIQFIDCLFNLNNNHKNVSFPNIKLFYEPNKKRAAVLAKSMGIHDYQYIGLTTSSYDHKLDYQKGDLNTHTVIGQEFDKVCMIMDDHFFYDEENHLSSLPHPNPDYICTNLLRQGLTRARIGIALVVTTEHLVKKILPLLASEKTAQ